MRESISAPPKASILIESMRDIGYSLETAIADVVDNSISAGASIVDIRVDSVGPQVCIAIIDNGTGMSESELFDSMRLGSRHPREDRNARDLGRFGLGLKTASFSQCRRLTVVSRRKGETSAATWDLDHVESHDAWDLLVPGDVGSIPFVDSLLAEGTLVLWERLDRPIDKEASEQGRKHFTRRLDETREHLELVFHRFLSGEPGLSRVQIRINDIALKAFDPFHSSHPATIRGQTERVQVGAHAVEITPFTLPHHQKVTATEWDAFGGRAGYLKNQGFYLYRERRLIVHGTWFGLARQMELTKLARVRIDMPNGLDTEWHIDVKKASAQPPFQVRERLQRVISELGAPSRRVYTRRGARLHDTRFSIWERVLENGQIVYRLNQDSSIVKNFEERLPPSLRGDFRKVIQGISSGLPLDALFADLAGSPEMVRNETMSDDDLRTILAETYAGLLKAHIPPQSAPDLLRVMEPFRSNWDRAEDMLIQIADGSDAE